MATGKVKKGKRKKRTAPKYIMRRVTAILLFIAVVTGIVLSLTIFFKIEDIEIKGLLEIYTKQEVAAASGLKKGDNILRFSVYNTRNRICRELPYISEVVIKRVLPSTVVISVKEEDTALVLVSKEGSLIVTKDLKILSTAGAYPGKSMMIYGIEPTNRKPGEKVTSDNSDALDALRQLISHLAELDLLSDTTAVNTADRLNISLVMKSKVLVRFGTAGDIERKCLMLAEMMNNQLEESDTGILDLSVSGKATFAPRDDLEMAQEIREAIYGQ